MGGTHRRKRRQGRRCRCYCDPYYVAIARSYLRSPHTGSPLITNQEDKDKEEGVTLLHSMLRAMMQPSATSTNTATTTTTTTPRRLPPPDPDDAATSSSSAKACGSRRSQSRSKSRRRSNPSQTSAFKCCGGGHDNCLTTTNSNSSNSSKAATTKIEITDLSMFDDIRILHYFFFSPLVFVSSFVTISIDQGKFSIIDDEKQNTVHNTMLYHLTNIVFLCVHH